jgi:hypothetical protein
MQRHFRATSWSASSSYIHYILLHSSLTSTGYDGNAPDPESSSSSGVLISLVRVEQVAKGKGIYVEWGDALCFAYLHAYPAIWIDEFGEAEEDAGRG